MQYRMVVLLLGTVRELVPLEACAIRQGEVKDLPDDPDAAAFILARTSIREVPEPKSETNHQDV